MKHVELEQFLYAFTSRGIDSVSWAFLSQQVDDVDDNLFTNIRHNLHHVL